MPGSPAPAATNPPRAEDHRVRPSASTRSLSALSRTTNGPMRHVPAASLLTCNAADAAPAGHPATATSGGGADRAAAGTTATRATQITPALPAACAATQSRRRTADGVLMGNPLDNPNRWSPRRRGGSYDLQIARRNSGRWLNDNLSLGGKGPKRSTPKSSLQDQQSAGGTASSGGLSWGYGDDPGSMSRPASRVRT